LHYKEEEMDFKRGDLVFLTKAYENYIRGRNPKSITINLKISLINRLAKIEKIIDWTSPEGKKIKAARIKSGKWVGLPLEDNKYIISVYHYDLIGRKGQTGVIERTPVFSKDPNTGESFFIKMPDWIYKELFKKCADFKVELKDVPRSND
jgi:hypothetical protein